jgi:hypothetical protein
MDRTLSSEEDRSIKALGEGRVAGPDRSALATGVPQANLYVTGWHALFIDGLLVPAGCLINGTTITRYEAGAYDEWSSSTSSSKVTT